MATETMMMVKTKPCYLCGKTGAVSLPAAGVHRYTQGALAQVAFPTTPAEIREQFITGTHPACWTEMFGEEGE